MSDQSLERFSAAAGLFRIDCAHDKNGSIPDYVSADSMRFSYVASIAGVDFAADYFFVDQTELAELQKLIGAAAATGDNSELLELLLHDWCLVDNCRAEAEKRIEEALDDLAEYETTHDDSGSNYCSLVESYRFTENEVVGRVMSALDCDEAAAIAILERCNDCDLEARPDSSYHISRYTDAVDVESFICAEVCDQIEYLWCQGFDVPDQAELIKALEFIGVDSIGRYGDCSIDCWDSCWRCVLPVELLQDIYTDLIESDTLQSESGKIAEEVSATIGKRIGKLCAIAADDGIICADCCDSEYSILNQTQFEADRFLSAEDKQWILQQSYFVSELSPDDDCRCAHCGESVRAAEPQNVERLVGANLGCLNIKVDSIHCAESLLSVCRQVAFPLIKANRDKPEFTRKLRRGIILATIERFNQNREIYKRYA